MARRNRDICNLNDYFKEFVGIENLYKTTFGFNYTDGIKALCSSFEPDLWWLVKVITSYQPQLFKEEFQQWKLYTVDGHLSILICDNGNGEELIRKEINVADVAGNCTIWIEANIIFLPSEHLKK